MHWGKYFQVTGKYNVRLHISRVAHTHIITVGVRQILLFD